MLPALLYFAAGAVSMLLLSNTPTEANRQLREKDRLLEESSELLIECIEIDSLYENLKMEVDSLKKIGTSSENKLLKTENPYRKLNQQKSILSYETFQEIKLRNFLPDSSH